MLATMYACGGSALRKNGIAFAAVLHVADRENAERKLSTVAVTLVVEFASEKQPVPASVFVVGAGAKVARTDRRSDYYDSCPVVIPGWPRAV
ncbi:hypothetical protein D3C87_736800 [compost metagenome]